MGVLGRLPACSNVCCSGATAALAPRPRRPKWRRTANQLAPSWPSRKASLRAITPCCWWLPLAPASRSVSGGGGACASALQTGHSGRRLDSLQAGGQGRGHAQRGVLGLLGLQWSRQPLLLKEFCCSQKPLAGISLCLPLALTTGQCSLSGSGAGRAARAACPRTHIPPGRWHRSGGCRRPCAQTRCRCRCRQLLCRVRWGGVGSGGCGWVWVVVCFHFTEPCWRCQGKGEAVRQRGRARVARIASSASRTCVPVQPQTTAELTLGLAASLAPAAAPRAGVRAAVPAGLLIHHDRQRSDLCRRHTVPLLQGPWHAAACGHVGGCSGGVSALLCSFLLLWALLRPQQACIASAALAACCARTHSRIYMHAAAHLPRCAGGG